ncbi:trans-aconitate 2-methyltransferase [Streptomyces sulphureus]|uniref:trans-aconitate 2-methyltransferase n=1 Tax=Streptomyces sulphureus TaxID=47758 RepID=UPI0003729EC6|nr:trans-aconitate 2-methyltransferase [Streptomyces sulphureus]
MEAPSDAGPRWDPRQYLRHTDHRLRPVHDLLARVPDLPGAPHPRIADLGCGPGGPTAPLVARWPRAHVTGYDSSPEMLAAARTHAGRTHGGGTLDFARADLSRWHPAEPFDLLFSNAALHWVPGHAAAFASWLDPLPTGGVLAFQVPGNFGAPSHTLLSRLRNSPRWKGRLGEDTETPVLDPGGYLDALTRLGCTVDAWETTYQQLLHGEDPVLDWVEGTTLRPVLDLLADDPGARDAFLDEYAAALREAYPARPYGTPYPFRRIFVVAVKR